MLNSIFKISLFSSIFYMGIGFNYINDFTFLLLGTLFFTLSIIFIYIIYDTIINKTKSLGIVISKHRSMSELPGELSRTFKYVFEIDNIIYTMPNILSIGAFEYNIGDTVTLYIDKIDKKAIPLQVIVILSFLSVVFIFTSGILLSKG